MDNLILAGIAVVLLFALIGVISAGTFVAGKMSGGSTASPPKKQSHPSSALAGQEIAQAQAQATAIVKQAQSAGQSIVSSATVRAKKNAKSIVLAAQRRATTIVARARAASPPASSSNTTANTGNTTSGVTAPGVTSPSVSAPSTSGSVSGGTLGGSSTTGVASGSVTGSSVPTPVPAGGGTTPDLSGLPASWRVVGYNASFGSGPGSAGSITVTNRGRRTYSGVATVAYAGGGSASASFSGLAPGQTEVLPLNGPAYSGRGYHIVVDAH